MKLNTPTVGLLLAILSVAEAAKCPPTWKMEYAGMGYTKYNKLIEECYVNSNPVVFGGSSTWCTESIAYSCATIAASAKQFNCCSETFKSDSNMVTMDGCDWDSLAISEDVTDFDEAQFEESIEQFLACLPQIAELKAYEYQVDCSWVDQNEYTQNAFAEMQTWGASCLKDAETVDDVADIEITSEGEAEEVSAASRAGSAAVAALALAAAAVLV